MFIRFIAHAGLYIEENDISILIDPWFRGSSLRNPVFSSINGEHSTIDFQDPPTQEKIEKYKPDVILSSHFHAHHSPQRDIFELISQTEEVKYAYPDIEGMNLGDTFSLYKNVTLVPMSNGKSISIGSVIITAYAHTVLNHLAWFIKGTSGSVLHIADARPHISKGRRTLDPLWDAYIQLKPDLIFMSAGGNKIRRTDNDGNKYILDTMFTPAQAANLIARLKPKGAAAIGCYNKSLWSTYNEYVPHSSLVNDELYWALTWTSPETKHINLKPSMTIGVNDTNLLGKVDTYFS